MLVYAAGLFCQWELYIRACLCIRSLSTLPCSAECVVPVGRGCVCVCVCVVFSLDTLQCFEP